MAIIIIEHYPDEEDWGQYAGVSTQITTNEGTQSVGFYGGEPEDMTLDRDLSDAWNVVELLKLAYNAGKNGEELEIEQITVNERG